jgi:GntR family transcriptional regulator, histidine utilization repressor
MKGVTAARTREPLYRQLKDHILAQVRSGGWSPGTRVPSENELVARYGVSRMTANRALRELMHDGYLHRIRGLGSFVRETPRQSSLLELRNIADEITARGHEHRSEVVELLKVRADGDLAANFNLHEGRPLYRITLVHFDNDLPVQLERRHVNPAVAPLFLRQDFSRLTPTAYLLSVAPVDELEHRVRAVLPDAEVRRLLRLEPKEPCLELTRASWSKAHVATRAVLTYPASRYELKSRYRTSPSGRFSSLSHPES